MTTYDPFLEGTELPVLMSNKPIKLKQKLDGKTQRYLREFLVKLKNLQPVEYDLDSIDGEEKFNAFVKTLQVLHKWLHNVDDPTVSTPMNLIKVNASGVSKMIILSGTGSSR